jgi:hypothetical protein
VGAWLQVIGWAGSAILITSLLQTRVLRLRELNLLAAVLLVVYNAVLGIWPMVAMNVCIAGINVWHLSRLLRTRHDPGTYEVVGIGPGEEYLTYVLQRNQRDVERFNPEPTWDPAAPGAMAVLVLRAGETVGVVLARDAGDGVAQIDLDYVLPRFRDFTPGEFVYRRSGLFTERGFRRVVAPRRMRDADEYLARVGFRRDGPDRVLDLSA